MGDVHWIKLSTRIFTSSRKIKYIESLPNADTILVIWFKLLLLAGSINDGGQIYLTPNIPYTKEMLANELRRPLSIVEKSLALFAEYGMIELNEDYIYLTSWDKYQNTDGLEKIREQNRLRQANYRARHKNDNGNVSSNATVTQGNTPDKDKDKDKDNPINLSGEQTPSVTILPHKDAAKRTYLNGAIGKGVVLLSSEQIDDLLEKLSLDEFEHYVSAVADCLLNGKRYRKTHYKAILDMAAKDRGTS